MRLWIEVDGKHYYDVGLRYFDGNDNLGKWVWRFGERAPRFLEDFIEAYPKSRIIIRGFGDIGRNYIKRQYVEELVGKRNIKITNE